MVQTRSGSKRKSDGGDSSKSGKDKAQVEEKYRQERAKRLRRDGVNQYRKIDEDSLKQFAEDPWEKPDDKRDGVEKSVDVLIIGAGWGGILTAVRLLEAGVKNFMIIDKAGDFGGVWYWNRYPQIHCDTESYIYMPLLEESGYMPTEKYATGPEIRSYTQLLGKKYGLYEKTLFHAQAVSADWNEKDATWSIKTKQKDHITARYFISAGGSLHLPKLPPLPGIESFKGHSFHSSRWDYDYTGGNIDGNMDKLKQKRVGIIGTGASSIQVIPPLAKHCKSLYVFQRTPSSVLQRMDQPTEKEFELQMKKTPGWQKRRIENFNIIVSGGKQDEDLVADSWTKTMHDLPHWGGKDDAEEQDMEAQDKADFEKMEAIRTSIEETVHDEDIADKLKPWYKLFCKRPCFNNDYIPTFNSENVKLIDMTEDPKSQHIVETGIQIGQTTYDLDLIIYASGFEFSSDYSQRLGMTIRGQDGVTLRDSWADGISTLHGLTTRGFPNAFLMTMSQTGYTQNNTHGLSEQSQHIAYMISSAIERNIRTIQPTQEAQSDWVDTIIKLAKPQYKFVADCTPGYYTNEGADKDKWLRSASYGKGSPAFFKLLRDWRESGKLEGMEQIPYKQGEKEASVRSQL